MRIISGKYAKRKLVTLKSQLTRPTSDKVKESLFNTLGQFFEGGNVLDLYAGSGALGIEAVSRGFDTATLVDCNHNAVSVIKKNVALTRECERFTVLAVNDHIALKRFKKHQETFDLVFLDPPYAKQQIVPIMLKLKQWFLLNDRAKIVAETDEKIILPKVDGFLLLKRHQLGRTVLWIYEKEYEA